MQTTRVEVRFRDDFPDAPGEAVRRRIVRDLGFDVDGVRTVQVYTVLSDLASTDLDRARSDVFCDPVSQVATLDEPVADADSFDWAIEVGFQPGVTDNAGSTAREAIQDHLGKPLGAEASVHTSYQYLVRGSLQRADAELVAGLLHNNLVERAMVVDRDEFVARSGTGLGVPTVQLPPPPDARAIDLHMNETDRLRLAREGILERDGKGNEWTRHLE